MNEPRGLSTQLRARILDPRHHCLLVPHERRPEHFALPTYAGPAPSRPLAALALHCQEVDVRMDHDFRPE